LADDHFLIAENALHVAGPKFRCRQRDY
jgi:hypothetical protein